MRKVEFTVPIEVIKEFSEDMLNRNLCNEITGTTKEDEIIIEIQYDKDESKEVDGLENTLAELIENIEEEKED